MEAAATAQGGRATPDADRTLVLRRRVRLIVTGTIAYNVVEAVVALVAGTVASSSALIGFLRDMMTHHAQAVTMSAAVHRRSTDPEVSYLAFDIMTTQQGQLGIMSGWLDLSGQTQSGGETMAWMGHAGDTEMPGMASPDEITELESLPEPQMTERFLRLMIDHHRGALEMASYATARAESPDVATLAGKMNSGQESEIDLMQDMLVERGHEPEPAQPAGAAAEHDGHG